MVADLIEYRISEKRSELDFFFGQVTWLNSSTMRFQNLTIVNSCQIM